MADIKWSDLWKGEYSAATQYEVSDSVSYLGSSYTCILRPTIGTAPTNATYWQKLAQKGDTGATGSTGATGAVGPEGMVWKGAYNGATAYVVDDAVSYNGSSYICILASTGNLPTDTNYWQLVAQKGSDGAGSGDVVGPASATNNAVVLFDSTTGKLIKDSTKTLPTGTLVGTSDTQTLTNKTLTSPKINENVAITSTSTEINLLHGKTALGAFWSSIQGSPAYATATTITLTDTGNTNKYDLMFKKGVIVQWTDSTGATFKVGMVTDSSYATNVVTVTIKGSAVATGDINFKYCSLPAEEKEFIYPGTLGTGTDVARSHYPRYDVYPLCADAFVKTAGTTNATTFDILDDAVSIMPTTTTISIASAATVGQDFACNAPTTAIVKNSVVTLSITGVSTTPPVEAYVKLYVMPVNWRYLA